MIGKLQGTIDLIHQNTLFIKVGGVGYRVLVPTKMLATGVAQGKSIELFIHTYVREDILALYGFQTSEELFMFERLLTISGIGGRLGLAILSTGGVEEITEAVVNADVDFFVSVPGIGKKSAQRIIVELKSVLGDKKELDLAEKYLPAFTETIQALKAFGFSKEEAREAVHAVKDAKTLSSEKLLKEALKMLGK